MELSQVIIAIVLQALIRLGPTEVKEPFFAAIGVVALTLYLLGVNELLILFGGALLFAALQALRQRSGSSTVFLPLLGIGELVKLAETVPVRLDQLFFIFLKVGLSGTAVAMSY